MRHAPPDKVGARLAATSFKDVRDPDRIDRIVKDDPTNLLLLLSAEMLKASWEIDRHLEELIREIEPSSLAEPINHATANRAQLEAYRFDLKAAAANATAAIPRYAALLENERETVESAAQSLDIDDQYRRAALNGLEKRQAQSTAIMSKMLFANAEFYRALEGYVALLIEQFGNYRVNTDGRLMFSNQQILERNYNDACQRINDAITRVAELEAEQKKVAQFQQEEWERFSSGGRTSKSTNAMK
jgi:hypothetical protein